MDVRVRVHSGHLPLVVCEMEGDPARSNVALSGKAVSHQAERIANGCSIRLNNAIDVRQGEEVLFSVAA